jgi:hypothetical protein
MNTTNSNTGKRVEVLKGALEVSRVHATQWQKEGTLTAEIKQTITTKSYYPSKSVSHNLQDNPFSTADFGFSENVYDSNERRVVWIDVPTGSTVESVVAKLASIPSATIYRILANHPIVSDSQQYAIGAGLTSMEVIADKQAVRYPDGHAEAGKLILKDGKPQFKGNFFKATACEDQDLRTADPADFYATPKMKAELSPASAAIAVGQQAL